MVVVGSEGVVGVPHLALTGPEYVNAVTSGAQSSYLVARHTLLNRTSCWCVCVCVCVFVCFCVPSVIVSRAFSFFYFFVIRVFFFFICSCVCVMGLIYICLIFFLGGGGWTTACLYFISINYLIYLFSNPFIYYLLSVIILAGMFADNTESKQKVLQKVLDAFNIVRKRKTFISVRVRRVFF